VPIEVRRVPPDELRGWADSVSFANSEEMTDEIWRDVVPLIEPERTLGVFDGDQVVGGGSIFSFDVIVPGGAAVPSAGVTWIGIMPTHRRQGGLRQLMTAMFQNARERNEPLAVLWASEGSIYQRFGYGLSTFASSIDLERERAILLSREPAQGTVRLVEIDEAKKLFPPIFERNLATIPGFYSRSDTWWDIETLADFKWARRGMDRRFYAVHETDGVPDAYAMYRARHDWQNGVPGTELNVNEIMAVDGAALREMWRFIFGIDLVKRITNRSGSVKEPLALMVTEPRRLNLRFRDGMWLRVLDVPAALERRTYAADGTVVLDINDEFTPEAGGRFRLTTNGGRGSVERTEAAPDIELEARDLGALYLGGFSLSDLARADRTHELTPGSRARADAMLRTDVVPWCPQTF
jgi:predicted acetyltransferase